MPTHPKCGKHYPGNNTHGHCARCCETFAGLTSFDAHRVGTPGSDARRCEIQPYEIPTENGGVRYGHWMDNNGFWHFSKRLTAEEREELKEKLRGRIETD